MMQPLFLFLFKLLDDSNAKIATTAFQIVAGIIETFVSDLPSQVTEMLVIKLLEVLIMQYSYFGRKWRIPNYGKHAALH